MLGLKCFLRASAERGSHCAGRTKAEVRGKSPSRSGLTFRDATLQTYNLMQEPYHETMDNLQGTPG